MIRAGNRYCQAASTRARRAAEFPALVIAPWRRRCPELSSVGTDPTEFIRGPGEENRHKSPGSHTRVAAFDRTNPRNVIKARNNGSRFQALEGGLQALDPIGGVLYGIEQFLKGDPLGRVVELLAGQITEVIGRP